MLFFKSAFSKVKSLLDLFQNLDREKFDVVAESTLGLREFKWEVSGKIKYKFVSLNANVRTFKRRGPKGFNSSLRFRFTTYPEACF